MKTRALLSIVAITGLWTLSLCLSHQYHFINDRMNWTDAQQYCRDKFTDLATIHTLEDVNALTSMNPKGQIRWKWIGLYDDVNSWRWSLADEGFYKDAEEHTFRKWGSYAPSNSSKLCAAMSHNGIWKDRMCKTRYSAICFDDTEPKGKYIIISEALTWSEAQRECREKHTDLASVRNQAENREIQQIIMSNGNALYWIGLYRDSWKWSDGSSSSFRHWQEGSPDGNLSRTCTVIALNRGRSEWDNWRCNIKLSFICHSVKNPVLRVKLTINSLLDLNDPAVPDAILELLKQNTKDHQGAPADISVRWVKQADGRIFHKEDKKKKKRERKPVLTKREL